MSEVPNHPFHTPSPLSVSREELLSSTSLPVSPRIGSLPGSPPLPPPDRRPGSRTRPPAGAPAPDPLPVRTLGQSADMSSGGAEPRGRLGRADCGYGGGKGRGRSVRDLPATTADKPFPHSFLVRGLVRVCSEVLLPLKSEDPVEDGEGQQGALPPFWARLGKGTLR